MSKKYFYTILTLSHLTVSATLQATTLGEKIKSGFQKVGKEIKLAAVGEAHYLKNQAVQVKESAKAVNKDFKSGNTKQGFKDIGKVVYGSANLVTVGSLGSVKNGGENFYKGAKEVHQGNKKGWKDMAEGVGNVGIGAMGLFAPVASFGMVAHAGIQGLQQSHKEKIEQQQKADENTNIYAGVEKVVDTNIGFKVALKNAAPIPMIG